jgi:hypothetical protein
MEHLNSCKILNKNKGFQLIPDISVNSSFNNVTSNSENWNGLRKVPGKLK